MRKFLVDEGGQAVVEYILGITVAISVVTIIATGFRRSLFRVWEFMTKMISAACPGCPPDPTIRLK